MAQVSPFTRTVVTSMRHLYPEVLADTSFDNTGLLLEAPIPTHQPAKSNSVLLTIDLTKAVVDEAIEENHSTVIAYHPIIFRGLKSLTLGDSQQQSLLRLASHGISVYSPHTAVDIVPNGMADWLCDIVTGKIEPSPEPKAFTAPSEPEAHPQTPTQETTIQPSEPASETDVTTSEDEGPMTPEDTQPNGTADPFTEKTKENNNDKDMRTPNPKMKHKRPSAVHRTYSKPSYPQHIRNSDHTDSEPVHRAPSPIQVSPSTTFHHSQIPHTRDVIAPSSSSSISTANAARGGKDDHLNGYYNAANTGAGRLITFEKPQPLSSLITRIAHATGTPKGFPVAIPQDTRLEDIKIRTVALCPGSGGSVIKGCRDPPDLVFTGEMTHHEALAVIERGGCVITLFHSNSERGYLDEVLRERLEEELSQRWEEARKKGGNDGSQEMKEIFDDDTVSVVVSRRDRDPFGIVVLQESRVEGQAVG